MNKKEASNLLNIANSEITFQNTEKEKRAAELEIANKELDFQNSEKLKRAEELIIANKKLVLENKKKAKLAAELIIANKKLALQNTEKEKRAEELLLANKELAFLNNEQQALFASIVNSSDDAIFSSTLEGIITSWNNGAEKIFGYKANEIIGKSVLTFIPPSFYNEEWEILKNIREGKTVDHFRTERLRKDGTFFHASITISSIKNFKGEIVGSSKIIRDISGTKKLEQQKNSLLTTLEKSLNEIYVFDSKTLQFSYINQGALTNIGYSEQEIKELTPLDINPEFTATTFNELVKPLRTKEKEKIIFFTNHKRKNGSLYPVEIHLQFVEEGNNKSFLAVILDITERKKGKELLHKANTIARLGSWEVDLLNGTIYWSDITREIHEAESSFVPDLQKGINFYKEGPSRDLITQKIKEAIELGKPWDEELQIVTVKNNIRWIRTIGEPELVDGKCVRIIGSFQDITEAKLAAEKIKESESRLAASQLVAKVGSWETDLINFVVIWSEETCRIFGVANYLTHTTHEKFLKFVYPDDKEKVDKAFVASLTSDSLNSLEHRIITEDGAIKEIDEKWLITKDENGKPIRALGTVQDITERKKAESQLIESENYLRTILDNEPECVKVLNRKGELLSINQAGLGMLEADNEQLILGRRMSDLVNKKYQVGFNQLSKEIFKGNPGIFEFEITGLKGSHRWLETHAVPLKDTTGKIVKLLAVTRDVTKHKKAEEKIIESENRMRLATSSAGMGIWYWDNKTDTMVWDKKLYQIYDITESQLGSVYEGWLSRLHPEDKDRVNELMQTAIADKKREYSSEFRIIWNDLSVHYIKGSGITEYDDNGNVIGMMGVNWDDTAEKEKEQHLKLLESVITNTPDAVMITEAEPLDHPGPRILYVNEAFTKMTGYSSEEVIGKTPRILQGPKTDKDELKRLGEAIRKWQSYETTLINYKKNGEEFWINFKLTPVANEKGWYTHWISIERDVTEQKLAELKLTDLFKELQDYKFALDQANMVDISDKNGFIKNVNDNFLKISKFTREELIDQDHRILNSGYHGKILFQDLWKTVLAGKIWKAQVRNKAKDGTMFWVNTTIVPFLDSNGKAYQFMTIRNDITEQYEYLKTIESQNKKLREIAWTQSHIIRAPLSRMLGLLNIMEMDSFQSDDIPQLMTHFKNSLHELDNVIMDIVSKTESLDLIAKDS
jgi:PAS domain S-box-containing protein